MDNLLSIIVPVYNEEEVIVEFHNRLTQVCNEIDFETEVVYINDGSKDHTLKIIENFKNQDESITIINFSRNFGKEAALTAGLDYARGALAVIIDSDLQDPPELIPEMIKIWRQGYDVVYGQRTHRDGENWIKKLTAHLFYKIMSKVSDVEVPVNTGDFRLMSRRAINAICSLRENHRYMKGLFAWIGFPSKALPYRRDPRYAGKTKWSYWKLWNFALEGITSFSATPLKISTLVGGMTAMVSFLYASYLIYYKMVHGINMPGYASLMVVILFLGGVQLITIGIIGEYLARNYNESKKRALYFILELNPSKFYEEQNKVYTLESRANY